MRLPVRALALLGSSLLSMSAGADPAPADPGVRHVVGTTLSATQAAILDEDTGEYRLVRLGDEVNGAHVVAIGDGDVVLLRGGQREQIALAADTRPRPRVTLEPMVIKMRPSAPVAVAAAPVAVEATQPVAVAAPVAAPVAVAAPAALAAPVAAPAPFAVAVTAPVAAAPAPVAAPAPAPAPVNNGAPKIVFVEPLIPPPAAPAAAPVSIPAPVSTPAPAPEPALTTVPRAELDRGLGNFAALDASVSLEVAPQGGFRVANLQPGSFLEKLGLRRGDVIEKVDGRPLRGVEDASAAYNWVRVTDHFAVDLLRDGQKLTLRFQVTA